MTVISARPRRRGRRVRRQLVARRARRLIVAIYLLTAVDALRWWLELSPLGRTSSLSGTWPLDALAVVPPATLVPAVAVLVVASSLVAARRPGHRAPRIAVAAGLLVAVALTAVPGNTSHERHGWLWVSCLLAAWPVSAGDGTRFSRELDLLGIWSVQIMVGLIYGLSGAWKLVGAIWQAARGQLSTLSPEGVERLVVVRRSIDGAAAWTADWMPPVTALWLGFWGVALAELLVPIWLVRRPEHHRALGVVLVAFHVGAYLLLGIDFWTQVVLVVVLFVFSPWSLRDAAAQSR